MKVAVIGSGVSGLGATWLLNEHSDHEVHLYESDYRPGGHANTVHYVPKGKTWAEGIDVDTGFIVCNPSTYPNFLRFLRLFPSKARPASSWLPSFLHQNVSNVVDDVDEGIQINETEMTFSVSRDGGEFEWAGKNLATIFCQPHRILDPQMWSLIYDVLRFNACSRRVLLTAPRKDGKEMSIGQYLDKENYSTSFRNNYLVPMTAAIWSTPPGDCFLDFPARTLIQFMYNHNLLQIIGKPSWLTIHGGSHKYVTKILSKLPKAQFHLSTPIKSVMSIDAADGKNPPVVITTKEGKDIMYDHVILACHSDTALELLRAGNITDREERILSQFQWNRNEVILHCDERLMPKSRLAWSCWNYLSFTKPVSSGNGKNGYASDMDDLYAEEDKVSENLSSTMEVNEVSLTYGMNDLQHIPESKYGPVLVTLNAPFEPAKDKIAGRWKFDHPVIDSKAVRAQNEMYKIQNKRSISFAGAYLKYGFHEDGFTSGLLAACSLDEGQESLASSTSFTDALGGMTIPTRKLTVRPPFEIQHADHHVQLMKEGVAGIGLLYTSAAILFDILETSGIRELIGVLGATVLSIVTLLLRLLGVRLLPLTQDIEKKTA